jgi:type II secretory pathway predicted ATPase ExeA
MNEDYLAYWGMTKPPFSLTPDPEMLYLSGQHSECMMRLKYAIFSHKGGALLVSDTAGNGKTSILARLQNELREYYGGRVKVVFIDHPTLTPIEIIGEIARQLGGELHTEEKIRALNYLRDRLYAHYNENIKVVVIVDEGQMLKERPDILGELRILLNFCVSDSFLLTFIFSGQKPLDSILRNMPEFWQRLPVRFFLKNLDFNDTRSLVQFRLHKVGANPEIFTEDAYEGIFNYSEGCPRIICSVADLCLLIGFSKGVKRIGFVEVSSACRDMEASGDSFHYFTYIKGEQRSQHLNSGPNPSGHKLSPPQPDKMPSPSLTLMNSIPCPKCAEPNPNDHRFCLKCDTPLYRKCPGCGAFTDTVSDECPKCNVNMDKEQIKNIEKLREALMPYDILENNYAIWLQASSVTLDKEERVIIIFPNGNLFNSGPSVLIPAKTGNSSRKKCDLILTERRLILEMDNDRLETDLSRIETCMVTESGRLLKKRYEFIIGLKKGIYTIKLPRSASGNKEINDRISSYIQMVMMK